MYISSNDKKENSYLYLIFEFKIINMILGTYNLKIKLDIMQTKYMYI